MVHSVAKLVFSPWFWFLVEVNKVPSKQSPSSAPVSLASVMGSLGLKDLDLREDGSELAATLIRQLTGDWLLILFFTA